jgi:hypothetical protein
VDPVPHIAIVIIAMAMVPAHHVGTFSWSILPTTSYDTLAFLLGPTRRTHHGALGRLVDHEGAGSSKTNGCEHAHYKEDS